MKRLFVMALCALLALFACAACGKGEEELLALACTVSEVYDNAVMVVCDETAHGLSAGDRAYISCENMPALAAGDAVTVRFANGTLMETAPVQIVAHEIVRTANP